jgi:uncharacterized protein (UPF0276 family)
MRPTPPSTSSPTPVPASAGIGLRAVHHRDLLETRPALAWLEAHSENYFAAGGPVVDCLERLRANYPLSLHGVGLSLGSTDPLDEAHLQNLRRVIARFEPGLVSEHLSWSSFGGRFANDLLPLPYTEEALAHVSTRIARVQDRLGRQILIENVSSYLQFASSEMPEWEFVAGVAARSGCAILLDLNNLYVAASNHGFEAAQYLEAMPVAAVQELHLAGHSSVAIDGGRELLIDTHGGPVCNAVWDLYRASLRRFGPLPTLIEWDTDIPPLAVLGAEAAKADAVCRELYAHAA